MHAAEAYVVEALRAGALGYVAKDAHASELVRAIRAAAGGRRHLSPPLSEAGIAAYLERVGEAADDPYRSLTRREREVLQLAAEGCPSSAIGRRLGISRRTAESHRAHLLRKLGLRNQADITRFAVARGLLAADCGRAPEPGAEPAIAPRTDASR
jgi:DNA-binding NarL/FixJ family response regulator